MYSGKVYQYRKLNKNCIINLMNNEVRFSSPRLFNDPYDSKLLINSNVLDKIIISKKKISYEEFDAFKNIHKDEYQELIDFLKFIINSNKELKDEYKDTKACGFELPTHGTYVSCFSEDNLSMLMWSHYGDYHRGICIEYEDDFIIDERDVFFNQIIYADNIILDLNKDLIQTFILSVFFKSSCWAYEKEWRALYIEESDSNKDGFNFKVKKPTGIYMGSKISYDDEMFIKNYCYENKIRLYKINLDVDSFKLYPVEYMK